MRNINTKVGGLLTAALAMLCVAAPHVGMAQQDITLDGHATGRAFDGLGAISGGGNTSRLLPDYPATQRAQILDYLFRPQFGASLSVLKVEVGGDVNSTEGSEPSHMHTRTDVNYDRGFEWWLMEQAVARNQQIGLDCLAWGAPGWVGNGHYWSTDMMDYYIRWLKAAKRVHHLDIGSVGGKNESGYDTAWYIAFRKALNANGLSRVKLVGSDDWGPPWLNIAKDATTNPALAQAVDVFGGHVTWSENPAVASDAVLSLGKPLWDTEAHDYVDGPYNPEVALVGAFNTNYIKTKITKTLFWNLLWSYYPVSDYPDVGMMQANTPWSGHYVVLPELWGYAHINQFVKPGWRFVDGGGCGTLPGGGTYTTLKAPLSGDYSVILETGSATSPQTVRFHLAGGLSTKVVHVWRSDSQAQFTQQPNVAPVGGMFQMTLDPDSIYSLTTTTGQRKGHLPTSPANSPFPFPYRDALTEYPANHQARYLFDYEGCFESEPAIQGVGNYLTQDATQSASGWGGAYLPLTFLGSTDWKDYTLSADVYIVGTGAVSIHGRIGTIPGGNADDPPGYTLRVQDSGAWTLKSYKTIIAQGQTVFSANHWHNLRLSFAGATITGFVDGQQICAVHEPTYSAGLAGLGSGWNTAQFRNLRVTPNGL
jgi:hypothetical protein